MEYQICIPIVDNEKVFCLSLAHNSGIFFSVELDLEHINVNLCIFKIYGTQYHVEFYFLVRESLAT